MTNWDDAPGWNGHPARCPCGRCASAQFRASVLELFAPARRVAERVLRSLSWPDDYASGIGRAGWALLDPVERTGNWQADVFAWTTAWPLWLHHVDVWVAPSGQVWGRWPALPRLLDVLPSFTAARGGIRFIGAPDG